MGAYHTDLAKNVARCRDSEVRIQRALKLANVDLHGLFECHGIPLLAPTLFPPVGFSMQLLDQGHHPYICTGFGGKHFYSLYIYICTMAIVQP